MIWCKTFFSVAKVNSPWDVGGLSIVKPTINMTILFKVKSRPKTIGEILADSDDDGDMEMAGGDENNPGDANSR